ncbi:MAG TPA: VWA domain-containing protein [Urbifossiella sp.]|nr:VWA domain-containing protein [Urbifossiella sp.]
MRVRHKTPTLVSMWMLDVFCCALGCVTLLWLLNTRQAGTALTDLNEVRAQWLTTSSELDRARIDLKLALANLDSTRLRLNSEISQLTTQLGAIRTENSQLASKLGIAQSEAKAAQAQLDATKVALNAAETKLDSKATDLATLRDKNESAEDLLRKKQKEVDALTKKAKLSAAAADDMARLIRKKDDTIAELTRQAVDSLKLLDDAATKLAASKKDLDAASAAAKKTDDKTTEDRVAAAGTIKDLTKKISEANATIIDLQGEKAKLADKVDRITRDTENRFAGIAMTGKSAAFIVDMSGSMDKVDLSTPAPHKWPVVCETVAKVMRSIPTLERYQVIVFSSRARWLSTDDAQWQKFEGEKSVAAVKNALLKVRPEGDTNMHAAFEMAFALRPRGLDTIYLFSDGLPTSGPGLTAAQESANPPLDENKRGEILGKYIREKTARDWNRPQTLDRRVKIHAIGFFFESPDVGAFLWALARENDGSFVGMSKP